MLPDNLNKGMDGRQGGIYVESKIYGGGILSEFSKEPV